MNGENSEDGGKSKNYEMVIKPMVMERIVRLVGLVWM